MAETEKTVADDVKDVPTEPTLSIDELDTVAGGTLHAEFRRAPGKELP